MASLPERLAFCLDVGGENNGSAMGRSGLSRLQAHVSAVRQIVAVKAGLDSRHEFAVCLLLESGAASWLCGFTADAGAVFDALDRVPAHAQCQTSSGGAGGGGGGGGGGSSGSGSSGSGGGATVPFDLSSLVSLLGERFELPGCQGAPASPFAVAAVSASHAAYASAASTSSSSSVLARAAAGGIDGGIDGGKGGKGGFGDGVGCGGEEKAATDDVHPPPLPLQPGRASFVCRALVFFGRSNAVPVFTATHRALLLDHPFFVWDVIYTHDKPCATNCPQEILDALLQGEARDGGPSSRSFFFMVNGNAKSAHARLAKNAALLCIHPDQRPGDQNDLDECLPARQALSLSQRASNYFTVHRPSYATPEHVDKVVSKYGESGVENDLLHKLFEKYGPEPTKRQADAHRQRSKQA